MELKDYPGIVPGQYTGKEIEATAEVDLNNLEEAKVFYRIARNRLLDVNNWHEVAGMISAKFQVANDFGIEATREVRKKDYIRIDIPGPGSSKGDGFDWVCVEELKEIEDADVESIGFRVRPAQNPLSEEMDVAHFYTDEATSSFIIIREGTKVIAWVIDRNLKPNDKTNSLMDKIRDSTAGIGAIGMFSKVQWQGLADGLVKKVNSE